MGKARSKVKRPKTFKYNTDRKKLWKKAKQLPAIPCAAMKAAWDPKKSREANMKAMGLASDSNKLLSIAQTKKLINPDRGRKRRKKNATADVVMSEEMNLVDILEKNASAPGPPNTMKLSEPEAQFCMQMMEKYGEDYKAMAKDVDNYYQESAKQIKGKIIRFRKFPGPYRDFLQSKGISEIDIS